MVADKVSKELQNAIDALKRERDELDEKIELMEETLNKLGGERRGPGRPPKKGASKKAKTAKAAGRKRKKPNWSPEARRAASERMRKYWEQRRKENG